MPTGEPSSLPFLIRYQRGIRKASLSAHAKLIALVLATYADADGRSVFPSQRTIATDSGLALSTTVKRLAELSEAGWVFASTRIRGGRGWRRNSYTLAIPANASPDEKAHDHESTRQDQNDQQAVSTSRPGVYRDTAHDAGGVPTHGFGVYRDTVLTMPMTNPLSIHARAGAGDQGQDLAFGEVVQVITGQGCAVGQCTSERGRQHIRSWVERDVTMADLSQALARAFRAKPDGQFGPGYLNPIVHEFIDQRSRGPFNGNSSRRRESSVDVLWRNAALSQ